MFWASLVAQMVKNLPVMWETWFQSLVWEDPLEKGIATHSSILAWRIPWAEEPGRLQSMKFSRPEYWSRQPFPSPVDLPKPGNEPRSPTMQANSLPAEPQGRPRILEWVAHSFSSGSSQPRNQMGVFCIASRFFLPPNLSGKLSSVSQ